MDAGGAVVSARIYQFHVERARRRPYADFGTTSLEVLAQIALTRGETAVLELIVKEVKRRRAAQELAK